MSKSRTAPPSEPPQPPDESSRLPARPIPTTRLVPWLPRAATVACLGLTSWLAPRSAVTALALPFFGTCAQERSIASCRAWSLTSALLIWTVEGYRAGCAGTPLALPVVFGAAVQVFGIEKVAPVHHVLSIVAESGMSFDGHEEVDPDAAAAVLPATLLGHVLPVALMGLLPMTATEVSRSSFGLQSIACHLFYVSPIAVSFLTILGAKAIRFVRERRGSGLSTGEEEAVAAEASEQPDAEVPALKTAYAVAFGLQAIKHLSTVPWVLQCYENITSRLSRSAAVSAVRASKTLERGLSDAMATEPLPYYKLATGIVGLYEVWDLRRRGYVTTRESIQAAVIFGGALHFCGVGAGYAGLWYWRENIRDRLRQRSEIARTA